MVMPVTIARLHVPRLAFVQRIMGTEAIGTELGVTGRAVRYWLRGERGISATHFKTIERLYERSQYTIMRQSGLSPIQASKYRGLYPDTFDIWKDKIDTLVNKWKGRAIIDRLIKEDRGWDDLTDEEKDEYDWDAQEQIRDEIERSDKDIEGLERY